MSIECAHCGHEITSEPHDTTYANYTNYRVEKGQHTGDIYKCDECEGLTIDDFLDNVVRGWSY